MSSDDVTCQVLHGRNFVGCELNPEYIAMAHQRLGLLRYFKA